MSYITKILHLMSDVFNFFFGEHRHHHHHHKHHQPVRQVLVTNFNNYNFNFIIMSATFASNQQVPITLSLVDADTLQPVTATKTGEAHTSDHPEFAVVDETTGVLKGVAPGSGNLTSVATWTYTDANTKQLVTVPFTTITPFEVTQVVMAEKVQQVVTLGDPQPQPVS